MAQDVETKWAVQYREQDGEGHTELMTDKQLDQAADGIAAERASGHQVDLRLATEEDRARAREQEQSEQDHDKEEPRHDSDSDHEDRQRQHQGELEAAQDLQHLQALEAQQAAAQAQQQASQQPQPQSAEDRKAQEAGGAGEGGGARRQETDAEADKRITEYEAREPEERAARQTVEHYYGHENAMEPDYGDKDQDAHWRYADPQSPQEQERGQAEPQQQATDAQGGSPEPTRAPDTPQMGMER